MILQKYIARELIRAFIMVFFILFAIITLTGPFFKFFNEYQNIGASFLADVLPYFIPQVVSYIIPISILISSVFVFGRFSEDNEIMAIRCNGIHVGRVVWPIIFLGLLLTIFVTWLNAYVIPETQTATSALTVNSIKNNIMSPSLINRNLTLSEDYQVYYNDIKDNMLKDVSVVQLDKKGNIYQHLKARQGVLEFNGETSVLTMTLKAMTQITWGGEDKKREPIMSNSESIIRQIDISGIFIPTPPNLGGMSIRELNKMIRNNETVRYRLSEIMMEKFSRFAISFTPLLFLLIGMPIGIIIKKGSKVAGLGISALIIFAAYYPLTVLSAYLGETGKINPQLIVWFPDVFILLIAFGLCYRTFRK